MVAAKLKRVCAIYLRTVEKFFIFAKKLSYASESCHLIRISTIDKCLQNRYRRWTINNLIDACTDALAEYEGRSNPVSRRTFQNDLALMRSDRLGYNASDRGA